MLTAESISQRARQRPFRPFRVVTSSGERVDVTHPELMLVGHHDVVVGIPGRRKTP